VSDGHRSRRTRSARRRRDIAISIAVIVVSWIGLGPITGTIFLACAGGTIMGTWAAVAFTLQATDRRRHLREDAGWLLALPAARRRSEDGPLDRERLKFDQDHLVWTPYGSSAPAIDQALSEVDAITVWPLFMRLGSEVDIDTPEASYQFVVGMRPGTSFRKMAAMSHVSQLIPGVVTHA
jgi:hypothetical protein